MPTAAIPSIGSLVRDRMHERDLTPSELARALHLSRQTTYQLLNSQTRITKNTAPRLARVLGQTAQWWLRRQVDADLAQEGK